MNYSLTQEQLDLLMSMVREEASNSTHLLYATHAHECAASGVTTFTKLREAKKLHELAHKRLNKFLDKLHTENL